MPLSLGEITALIVAIIAILGLLVTWLRNGRAQKNRDIAQAGEIAKWKQEIIGGQEATDLEIKHINDELASPDHGLISLAQGQANFKNHCTGVSTALIGKVEANKQAVERNASNIKELQKRASK